MNNKVTTLPPPFKGIESWIIAGDWHSHHLHKPSFGILKAFSVDKYAKKNRNLIINGDFFDFPFFMSKNEDFKKWINRVDGIEEFFLGAFKDEIDWGNKMLNELQDLFNNIILIWGNHDTPRVNNFLAQCPKEYHHNFNLNSALELDKRGIKTIEYNNWLDIGDLSITHGMYHGPSAAKKHYEASGGRNVVYSHVHQYEVKPFTSRGKTRQAVSLPAMCELSPHYIKNSDNNWSNGFGEINFKTNGHFNLQVYQIWDDALIVNGKTYTPLE